MLAKTVLAAIAACGILSSLSAGAFTYDNRTNQGPNGEAQLRAQALQGQNGRIGNSHFSVQFSGSGYGAGQSGADSRFVPSANPDLQNPFYSPNNLDTALANHR